MTTARDYKLISEALRKAKPTPEGDNVWGLESLEGWEGACKSVARALKERNPLFDEQRFMRDCGAVATERCNETRP